MKAIVTVNGVDKVGIIAQVSTKLAQLNININDIRQTTIGNHFDMIMIVDMQKCEEDFLKVSETLSNYGREIGMEISIRRKDIFDAMHKIWYDR